MINAKRTALATAAAIASATALLGQPTPADAIFKSGGTYYFQSPSKNINCEGHRKAIFCAIYSRTQAITFRRNGRWSEKPLASNPSIEADVLSYGTTINVYGFRCTSLESGMKCVRRSTGHGVLLSRDGAKGV